MTSWKARAWWPVLIPIAVMADSSIWQGWTVLAQQAGMGHLAVVPPLAVVCSVTYALVQRVRSSARGVRQVWAWTMAVATAGSVLGAAIQAGAVGESIAVAALVWVTPLACVLAAVRLYVETSKEESSDVV